MIESIIRYRKYPLEFIKDSYPDMWNSLYWYQKVYISSLIKSQNLKKQFVTLVPRQRVCINCGKKFKDKQYYYKPCRGSSKTIMETARLTRTMCCSDGCFTEYLNKFWDVKLDKEV